MKPIYRFILASLLAGSSFPAIAQSGTINATHEDLCAGTSDSYYTFSYSGASCSGTLTWTVDNGTVSYSGTSATVTWNTSAVDYTALIRIRCNGTDMATRSVSIRANKAPSVTISTSQATTFCQGTSSVLFTSVVPMAVSTAEYNAGNTGVSYDWLVDNVSVGVYTSSYTTSSSLAPGLHSILCQVTPSYGCWSSAATVSSNTYTITVTGPPTVTGATTFCGTGALTVQPGMDGKNYWYASASGGSPFDTDGTTTEYLAAPGTYTYYISSYSSKAGCETSRTAVTATVYDKAYPGTVSGITAPVRGGIYIYTASNPYNNGLSWTVPTGSAIVSSQANSIHVQVGTVSGTIGVVASDGRCGAGYASSLDIVSSDINYVRDETILVSSVFNPATILGLPVEARISKTAFIDGLGRSVQELVWQQSPLKKDVIRAIDYDAYGRTPVQYLPFAAQAGNGSYIANWAEVQPAFYQATAKVAADNVPSSKTVFEPSPLDRVLEQGGPGAIWQPADQTGNSSGHTVKTAYLGNAANEVRLWQYDYATGLCISPGSYTGASLYKTRTTDENGNQSWNYTDVKGRTVYKKVVDTETYYVYDDFGLLRITIPPMGTQTLQAAGNWTVTQAFLDTWCYQYQYDYRQRMSQKKIPGAQWAYMVYDDRDRLALTQDGNQRATNAWLFTKHDIYNRPVAAGVFTYTGGAMSQAAMQAVVDGLYNNTTPRSFSVARVAASDSYTDESFPTAADGTVNYLTYTYYDDYSFKNTWNGSATAYDFVPELTVTGYFGRVNNKVTGTKVKTLNDDTWLKTVSYYDDRERVVQTIADSYTATGAGGIDRATNLYDFAGRVTKNQLTHAGITAVTVLGENTYDHASRLTDVYHTVNGGTRTQLAHYEYNELGQQVDKKLHVNGGSSLQSVDYRYNIRGWLTSINNASLTSNAGVTNDENNDLFGMELRYDAPQIFGWAQYNGNIAEIAWNRKDHTTRATLDASGYSFGYDQLNRMTSALFSSAKSTNVWTVNSNYDENLTYDKNGNIKTLNRNVLNGSIAQPIDNLTYTYSGNQTTKIEDATGNTSGFKNGSTATTEYTYDANGNMLTDLNKGLIVTYNYLNLPQTVTISGSPATTIAYAYDATGRKWKKTVTQGATTHTTIYIGGIQFTDNVLTYIQHAEGRVRKNGSAWSYEYYLKDHLGNVRTSFDNNGGTARTIQEDDFYPFGFSFNSWLSGQKNEYLYNGKELQEETSWYDYGTRYYDITDRFTTIDPLAEHYEWQSPYVYAANNPVRYQDHNGEGPLDMVLGAVASVIDNAAPVPTSIRQLAAGFVTEGGEADFNHGQDMGDKASMVAGAAMLAAGVLGEEGGTGAMMVGLAAEAPSGGASTVVVAGGAVVAGAGTLMAGAGVLLGAKGASSLAENKGRLEARQTNSGYSKTKHIDNRHIDRNKYPEKSKYSKPNQIDKLNEKTMKKPDKTTTQSNGRVVYEKDMKRKIGTQGQTKNKVVTNSKKEKIITSYPTD